MSTRRTFLKEMSAMAAIGMTGIATAKDKTGYDPKARYVLKVSEVPFRKNAAGRQLMARLYPPQAAGPVPVVVDLHGGACQCQGCNSVEPVDQAIASLQPLDG